MRTFLCQNLKNNSVIWSGYADGLLMVWIKFESKVKQFMNKIDQKQSIKFDFKFSKERIELMDISTGIADTRPPSTKN